MRQCAVVHHRVEKQPIYLTAYPFVRPLFYLSSHPCIQSSSHPTNACIHPPVYLSSHSSAHLPAHHFIQPTLPSTQPTLLSLPLVSLLRLLRPHTAKRIPPPLLLLRHTLRRPVIKRNINQRRLLNLDSGFLLDLGSFSSVGIVQSLGWMLAFLPVHEKVYIKYETEYEALAKRACTY